MKAKIFSLIIICLFLFSCAKGIKVQDQPSFSPEGIIQEINLVQDMEFEGQPENLGQAVNSEYSDVGPVISPDGKTLFFFRKNHPDNIGGEDDIWVSEIDSDGKWQPARNIGKPLNSKRNDFVCSVSPDGNSILIKGPKFPYLRYKTKQGWSKPEVLKIRNFKNKHRFIAFYLANDEKTLLISAEMNDSFGERDLYVSFRQDKGRWSKPMNLGSVVNTSGDEGYPFIASDGTTLYFGTDGHPGYGGKDIFVTKRLDDSWKNWSIPMNIGPPINTERGELGFTSSASGDYVYYTSDKDGYGRSDIYRIKLAIEAKPEPVVLIYGKIYNAMTKEALAANITYKRMPEGEEVGTALSDPQTGEYKIILSPGHLYSFRAESEGLLGISEDMDLGEINEYTEIEKDVYLGLAPEIEIKTAKEKIAEIEIKTAKEKIAEIEIKTEEALKLLELETQGGVPQGATDIIKEQVVTGNVDLRSIAVSLNSYDINFFPLGYYKPFLEKNYDDYKRWAEINHLDKSTIDKVLNDPKTSLFINYAFEAIAFTTDKLLTHLMERIEMSDNVLIIVLEGYTDHRAIGSLQYVDAPVQIGDMRITDTYKNNTELALLRSWHTKAELEVYLRKHCGKKYDNLLNQNRIKFILVPFGKDGIDSDSRKILNNPKFTDEDKENRYDSIRRVVILIGISGYAF